MSMARILVIDDEADMRTMLEQMLKSSGHEVVSAANGQEGVELYRATSPDVVILDLVMPVQEGLETIAKLRKEFPNVVIVAMSGKTAATTMLTVARRLGAVAVLQKPFLPEQLMSVVEEALQFQSRPGEPKKTRHGSAG
jgi:CheY-like chemotaxis protein